MTDFQIFVIIAKARRGGGETKKSRQSVIFLKKRQILRVQVIFSAHILQTGTAGSRVCRSSRVSVV